jgi:hypothetical protein
MDPLADVSTFQDLSPAELFGVGLQRYLAEILQRYLAVIYT